MAATLQHAWKRESNRRSRCSRCDLLAESRTSTVDRRPYTRWTLGGNEWDSRSHPTPACPPKGV